MKMIKTVTITGADDSIRPDELRNLSIKYPFVEWGILVSRNNFGRNRFPSKEWINQLFESKLDRQKFSCHLCGDYVKETLLAQNKAQYELGESWEMFGRVQINTHGVYHPIDSKFTSLLSRDPNKEWIFQYDNINTHAFIVAINDMLRCSALFDLSHGAGVLPEKWPHPIPGINCGYAGGLSIENLKSQLTKISKIVPSKVKIWIDVETKVRSDDDQLFDLKKVEKFLAIAEPYCINN